MNQIPLPRDRIFAYALFWIWFTMFCLVGTNAFGEDASTNNVYMNPPLFTGLVYDKNGDRDKPLFSFHRTAKLIGSQIHVVREFTRADGVVAARERIVYEACHLVSYELEDLQNGATASVVAKPDAKQTGEPDLVFEYHEGTKTTRATEKLTPQTVISDMVGPFIQQHWDELVAGDTVRLRFVSATRAETFGFKLKFDSESIWRGQSVIMIKMDPTSFIVAHFLDPLMFTVEKNGLHRVLQYSGPTTPLIRKNGKWDDFEAITVFNWHP